MNPTFKLAAAVAAVVVVAVVGFNLLPAVVDRASAARQPTVVTEPDAASPDPDRDSEAQPSMCSASAAAR